MTIYLAVGAVVKPVVGMSDGMSNVMHGISNEVSSSGGAGDSGTGREGGSRRVRQIRPCRTFFHSSVRTHLCMHTAHYTLLFFNLSSH